MSDIVKKMTLETLAQQQAEHINATKKITGIEATLDSLRLSADMIQGRISELETFAKAQGWL